LSAFHADEPSTEGCASIPRPAVLDGLVHINRDLIASH
jgi:hypothetical protein